MKLNHFDFTQGGGITIRSDEKILAALLSTTTVKQAAQEAGVSESTIRRRLQDPEFSERYHQARLDMLKNHVSALHGYLGVAISTLGQVMANKDVSAQTRVNAAEAVLRNCMKLTEQADILAKLDELESMLEDKRQ